MHTLDSTSADVESGDLDRFISKSCFGQSESGRYRKRRHINNFNEPKTSYRKLVHNYFVCGNVAYARHNKTLLHKKSIGLKPGVIFRITLLTIRRTLQSKTIKFLMSFGENFNMQKTSYPVRKIYCSIFFKTET